MTTREGGIIPPRAMTCYFRLKLCYLDSGVVSRWYMLIRNGELLSLSIIKINHCTTQYIYFGVLCHLQESNSTPLKHIYWVQLGVIMVQLVILLANTQFRDLCFIHIPDNPPDNSDGRGLGIGCSQGQVIPGVGGYQWVLLTRVV